MAAKPKLYDTFSPGKLYSGITSSSGDFEATEKIGAEKDSAYVQFCKNLNKRFPGMGRGAVYPEKTGEAVKFLGWRLTSEEHLGATKSLLFIGVALSILIILFLFFIGLGFYFGPEDAPIFSTTDYVPAFIVNLFPDSAFIFFMIFSVAILGIVGFVAYSFYNYPESVANEERSKALSYVPEIVGYLIMSMKLVPNLEKAIEFAAKHGTGKIADEFKRLLWDFQIGIYSSVSEGVDAMAYRWGNYSSEFKEALMKIRASVMESSESRRYQLLDKTMLDVLEKVKIKLEDYARGLSQPAIMLFYLGVLLPLILIIILPVGSAFSGQSYATPGFLLAIYCILIPLISFSFAKNVVKTKPVIYEPPIISNDFPGIPGKWGFNFSGKTFDSRLIFVLLILVGVGVSLFVSTQGIPPKFLLSPDPDTGTYPQLLAPDKTLEDTLIEADMSPKQFGNKVLKLGPLEIPDLYIFESFDHASGTLYNTLVSEGVPTDEAEKIVRREYTMFVSSSGKADPTKYIFWSGFLISLACAIAFLVYAMNIAKRKAQERIMQMEEEFKESIYLIASRMGENKPVETALKQANDLLPNLLVTKVIFMKAVENVQLLGLNLERAVFDPNYGAMKNIPSKTIATAMKLMVDSVNLSVEVASRTLMGLSMQLENVDKVNKVLKTLVADVNQTMTTMTVFIAPIVLGITVALQKVVVMTLAGVVTNPELETGTTSSAQMSGALPSMDNLIKVSPETFQSFATPLVFFIIVAIYVAEMVIIMTYFTTKIKEDNDLLFKINLAQRLPIAISVFVITVMIANSMISAML